MYKTKKFKAWQSEVLFNATESAVKIKNDIEALDFDKGEHAVVQVSTVELHLICAALEAAYTKLLDFSLVQNGNIQFNSNIH